MGFKKIPKEKIDKILELSDQGVSRDEIARQVGISQPTVSKYIRRYSEKKEKASIPELIERITQLLEVLGPKNLEEGEDMTGSDFEGVLARQKLMEQQRKEFERTIQEKIDRSISEAVSGIQKQIETQMSAISQKIERMTPKVDERDSINKLLDNWNNMSDEEKRKSKAIPRGAYLSMWEEIASNVENIPGIKRKVLDNYVNKEDLVKRLKNKDDKVLTEFSTAICTNDQCRANVQKKVKELQKKYPGKKKFFLEK